MNCLQHGHRSLWRLKDVSGHKLPHIKMLRQRTWNAVEVCGDVQGPIAARHLNGFLGNEVSVMLLNLSSVEQHAKAGKARLLAAATEKRVSHLPDLPTISETVAGFNTSVWFGLWGPGKMPPDLLAKIHADVAKALDHPETTKFFSNNSFERVDLSPQDVGKLIQSDLEHWSA